MKKPRYTDQQIAQALRQAEQGTAVAELALGVGFAQQGQALVTERPRVLVVAHLVRGEGEPDQRLR
jgi:hypothetical protein